MPVAAPKKPKKKAKKVTPSEELKRLKQAHDLADTIKRREIELAEQSTRVATAKAKAQEERTAELEIEKDIEELKKDLVSVSAGGHSERLFPIVKQEGVGTGAQAVKAGLAQAAADKAENTDDDQKLFNAATLDELGITGSLADKLSADGIRTGADLQKWFAEGHLQRKISGVGDEAKNKLQDAMATFYENLRKNRPDPKAFDPDSEEEITVLKEGRTNYLRIAVAKRLGGTFGSAFAITLDAALGSIPYTANMAGAFPSREKAICEAVEMIKMFVDSKRKQGSLDDKATKRADQIVKHLDGLDVEAVAPTNGDPTPRDEKGKTKRFKGNKRIK